MSRRRLARGAIAGAVAAAAVVLTAPGAWSDDPPITIPPPPVAAPPVAYPDALAPALGPATPPASYACGTYSSTAFTADFVAGVVVPVLLQQAVGAPPADLRPLALYMQLAASGCGGIPAYESPSRCATDEEMAARMADVLSQVIASAGLETLEPYVGLTLPTEGMIVDSARAVERFLVSGDDPADAPLASALAASLDCTTVVDEARRRKPPTATPTPTRDDAGTGGAAEPVTPLGAAVVGDVSLTDLGTDRAAAAVPPGAAAPPVASGLAAPALPVVARAGDEEWRPWMVVLSALLVGVLVAAAVSAIWQPPDDVDAT